MGFSEKDTTTQVDIETKAMGVVIRRRAIGADEDGAPVRITVETTENGTSVNKPVPQEIVDAAWPGTSKSFKAHLFAIIDAALA